MKRNIQTGIIFSYNDLIIAHYIILVLVWGVFVTDIEEAFRIDLYNNIDSWWKISTYFLVFILSILMTFHLSGRPLSFFDNGIAWFRNEIYLKRRATALAYFLIALLFNPITYLIYEPHWIILIPDAFLMFMFTREILYSNKLRKKVKEYKAEERMIHKSISKWIDAYDFKAIDSHYKLQLERDLSFEELLKLIIDFKSPAYLKMNYKEIKEAYYPIGWQRDSEPSGFDLYCDEVFHKVVDEDKQ